MTLGWTDRVGSRSAAALLGLVFLFLDHASLAQERRAPEQNGDGMDTHLFRPALDTKGFLGVNGPDVMGKNDVCFGMVLDYGNHLMRTNEDREETGTAPSRGDESLVSDSYQGTFNFNYGLTRFLSAGLTMPVVLMAGDAANDIGRNGALYDSGRLDAQTLSNLAIHAKLRLVPPDKGFGLAVAAQAGFPLTDVPRDLGADPGFWYWPHLILEGRVGTQRMLRLGIDVGYRGHTGQNPRFENDSDNRPQLAEGAFEAGNLATFGAALSFRAMDALDIVAETDATYLLADADSGHKLSQEILGGVKIFIEENSFLTMGAGSRFFSTGFEAADLRLVLGFMFEPSVGDADGDGIRDDEDECPLQPEDFDDDRDEDGCPDDDRDGDGIPDAQDKCITIPEDKDGDEDTDGCPEMRELDSDHDGLVDSRDRCPKDPEDIDQFEDDDGCPDLDNDKDGIPDHLDRCPDEPEDKDNYQDDDGCPDPDNDNDKIPDAYDKCPTDPENYNGFQDEDGCPEKNKVIIEENSIVILEQVQFETGSAKILPASKTLLDEVASTLREHPEFLAVEVAGHADERGTDANNIRLTKARAASVMQALQQRNIATNRLVSQGYGEYCPLDKASTPDAWTKNRRVEFKIVKTRDGSTNVERGCRRAEDAGITPPAIAK